MNIEKIYDNIERNRRLDERSSYPIFVKMTNSIIWFNYTYDSSNGKCNVEIIFVSDCNGENVKDFFNSAEAYLSSFDINNVKVSEENYYGMFMKVENMTEALSLIAQTEEAQFLDLYKAVLITMNFIDKN